MEQRQAVIYLRQNDPILAEVIERIGNDSLELSYYQEKLDLLTALSQAIIFQQISTKVATKIFKRFVLLYQESHTELTAKAILETPEDILRSVGISRPKISYLKDLAGKIEQGLPSFAELSMMEDGAVIASLTQVKGIGIWTAQMFLIFHLNRPDVLPVNDLGIRSAIANLYHLNSLPDAKTIEKLAQKWQPHRSLACRYLWRSLAINDRVS
ncbi:DNA-3-methyladenine glycosylase [Aerosakkonemataceae cyanobacterium BLCC-F154]|uniref:DNA-3-methyladenine glycosylase II n=1 Tax=Floridaenema fluviatile BLCC-F154 TaxID=3153640 RepID=A0ABV4YIL1_9CYAN